MDGLIWTLLSLGLWIFIIASFVSAFLNKKRRRSTIAHDGHVIPPDQDITCEGRDGHQHPQPSAQDIKDYGRRYIVHNDPETGYVILNGIKRKLSDCKDL